MMAVFHDTAGTDTINGTDAADQAYYNGGNDLVSLGGGDDTYIVETISGNADHVTVNAGEGTDTLQVSASTPWHISSITIDLAAGTATLGATTLALTGFEHVTLDYPFGNPDALGSASISGNDVANLIKAENLDFAVNTVLNGRDGDDTIVGGTGHDLIDGGNGNDSVYGEWR